jgi:16S rRNA (cytosine1402-N4)-methyltransferase
VTEGHVPVLFQETMELLAPSPGECFLDGTAGAGGHSEAIALRIGPAGLLVSADGDPSMLRIAAARLAPYPWVRTVHADFSDLERLREAADGRAFDGILLDLGISSIQLDDPGRGFTFREDGPLDMRRDPEGGGPSAADLLRTLREKEIADLVYRFGEERFSRRIAARIVEERRREPIGTTGRLARLVASAIPRKGWPRDIHPATRTFQALRIAVNGELDSVSAFLERFQPHLAPGGRVGIISFHSLEDRLVKVAFRAAAAGREASMELLTRKPVVPSPGEVRENPRSRSARFRVARRIAGSTEVSR